MSLTIPQVLSWSPGQLSQAATILNSMSSQVASLSTQFVNKSDLAGAWTGTAGDAAKAAATEVAIEIESLSRAWNGGARVLFSTSGRISEIQSQLKSAIAMAAHAGATLDDSSGAYRIASPLTATPDPTTGVVDPAAQARVDQQNASNAASALAATKLAGDALQQASKIDMSLWSQLVGALSFNKGSRDWVIYEAGLLSGNLDPNLAKALRYASILFGPDGINSANYTKGALYVVPGQGNFAVIGSTDETPSIDDLYSLLTAMSPGELAVFFEQLTPEQAEQWKTLVARTIDADPSDDTLAPPPDGLLNLLSYSAKTLTRDEWAELTAKLPFFEPAFTKDSWPLTWHSVSSIHDPNFDPSKDVNQGTLGDCTVLSTLIAYGIQNPDLLERNITYNANGSVTVTLYRDGQPIEVTVAGTLPGNVADNSLDYARTLHGDADSNRTAIYYEKAIAQLAGGYEALDHGEYPQSLPSLIAGVESGYTPEFTPGSAANTGTDIASAFDSRADRIGQFFVPDSLILMSDETKQLSTSRVDVSDVITSFQLGRVLLMSTPGDAADGALYVNPEKTLVGPHAYAVVAVNEQTQTITVQNPWGAEGSAPQFVEINNQQFHDYFESVTSAPNGK